MKSNAIAIVTNVKFEGVKEKEQPPQTFVYIFDSTGKLLDSEPVDVKKCQARLSLPSESAERTVRLLVGPRLEEGKIPTLSTLSRMGAYEKRLRVDPDNPKIDLTILDPVWRPWFLCSCVVRGRLVKRLTLPDGSTKELPICHARVTICEVDPIPIIIARLPDDILRRLRDELLVIVRKPFPPPPPPEELPGPFLGPLPGPLAESRIMLKETGTLHAGMMLSGSPVPKEAAAQPMELRQFDTKTQNNIQAIAMTASMVELRRNLIDIAHVIRPFICHWPWLNPFFYYHIDCIRTVMADENGRFQTTIWYPCFGDKPDLYFKAEQLHGGVWETIYGPSVRCNTYWDYACGTEVVINVTDPSAIPCVPEDPVNPPAGVTTWVMPYAVGNTKIWGTPPMAPPAPVGWVKSDGKTDYSGIVDAPFGSTLGFRHGYSFNIPSADIKYYRWSYRKGNSGSWKHMDIPVYKHYVKQSPGMLPTFPAKSLGPHTIGANSELFEFKPNSPPLPDPGDPAGTFTYWPTDDFFGDIYSGFLNTIALLPNIAGAAGQYQIKLEVFDSMGDQVLPGAGTFHFIVPSGVEADGVTVIARETQASEIDAGGFVFSLHIDNNGCTAVIDAPHIGATAVADACGFLRYDLASAANVTIAFHAKHPNNFATFSFGIVRGATYVNAAAASGEVAAPTAGGSAGPPVVPPYTGDGIGNFTKDFARAALLDTCVNAAFSENLYVAGKATNGWGRIGYDASYVRAFALAPQEP